MRNEILLVKHFVSELLSSHYEYERTPEPDLVMENPENVREYRDAGLVDGNGSSVYLYNLILLCGAIRPGMVVLDLACGPANLLIELAKLNPLAEFVGVDLSPEMLRCGADLRKDAGVTNVRFVQGDITDLASFSSQSTDLLMSTLSLHHIPELDLLRACFGEIARVVKPTGAIHLMDFASLKRSATAKYFAIERTKGLGRFLAQDYENSLLAAYRIGDFETLMPVLRDAVPTITLRKTFGVPFLVALTSLDGSGAIGSEQTRALAAYWGGMRASQQKDFNDMRLFFRLGGLSTPHPRSFSPQ